MDDILDKSHIIIDSREKIVSADFIGFAKKKTLHNSYLCPNSMFVFANQRTTTVTLKLRDIGDNSQTKTIALKDSFFLPEKILPCTHSRRMLLVLNLSK